MTRLDAWKARLRSAVAARGRRVALARFLADGDETRVPGYKVQIAKVLNQGAGCEAEFLLACEDWIKKTDGGK